MKGDWIKMMNMCFSPIGQFRGIAIYPVSMPKLCHFYDTFIPDLCLL